MDQALEESAGSLVRRNALRDWSTVIRNGRCV